MVYLQFTIEIYYCFIGTIFFSTDFYHTKKDATEKIGFPKGMRDQILYGAMQRYDPDCWLQTMSAESGIDETGINAPPAIEEITVQTDPQRSESRPAKTNTETHYIKRNFDPSDYKNGAVFENHCWSQTLKDIELHIRLPSNLQTAKQLCIAIKAEEIKVQSKNPPLLVILEGVLSQRIRHNEVVWSIEEGNLLICCGKCFKTNF